MTDGCGMRDICDLKTERHRRLRRLRRHTKLKCSTMMQVACYDRECSIATCNGYLLLLRTLRRAIEQMTRSLFRKQLPCAIPSQGPCKRVCARSTFQCYGVSRTLQEESLSLLDSIVGSRIDSEAKGARETTHTGGGGADHGVGYRTPRPPSAPSASSSPPHSAQVR
jgi:hypothetical protein